MKQQIKDAIMRQKTKQREQKELDNRKKNFTDSDMTNVRVEFPLKFAIDPRNIDSLSFDQILDGKCEGFEIIFNDTEQTNILDKFINNSTAIKGQEIKVLINSELANKTKHEFVFKVDMIELIDLPIVGNDGDNLYFTVRFKSKDFKYTNLLTDKTSVNKPRKTEVSQESSKTKKKVVIQEEE